VTPFSAFHQMAEMRDGYRNECKQCNLQQKHGRDMADPEPGQFRDDPIRLAEGAACLSHWESPEHPPRVRLLIGG
jgi:hypothetical protein